jgi:hypothetical protein
VLAAQQSPAIRPIGAVSAVSPSGLVASVSAVRALSDGRVIVNDVTRRQLLLLDADLRLLKTIVDTSMASGGGYGSAMAGLTSFRDDSSLFIEPRTLSILVVDPSGSIARVMANPSPADAAFMIGGPFGAPGYAPNGTLLYRGAARGAKGSGNSIILDSLRRTPLADSAPVIRLDLSTRARDTVAFITIPREIPSMKVDKAGKWVRLNLLTNPMPIVDAWTMLPDGSVAIVRGRDFRVEWYDLDGRLTSSRKVPFNWQRLDESQREAYLDSARTESDVAREAFKKSLEANPSGSQSGNVMAIIANSEGSAGKPNIDLMVPRTEFVDATALADYRPAFRMGSALSDATGNVWVRTTAPTTAGPIYSVINGGGDLIDRVQLPFGRMIIGFGHDVVYMGVQDEHGARLERAALR